MRPLITALIRTYAEKESELTERLAELDEERTRIALELEASRTRLADYREKEEAINEEREQLASVRDILSNSMSDSSRGEQLLFSLSGATGVIICCPLDCQFVTSQT